MTKEFRPRLEVLEDRLCPSPLSAQDREKNLQAHVRHAVESMTSPAGFSARKDYAKLYLRTKFGATAARLRIPQHRPAREPKAPVPHADRRRQPPPGPRGLKKSPHLKAVIAAEARRQAEAAEAIRHAGRTLPGELLADPPPGTEALDAALIAMTAENRPPAVERTGQARSLLALAPDDHRWKGAKIVSPHDSVPAENWAPIPGYEGFYEVSDQGRVRSLPRTVPMSDGRTYRIKGRLLNPAWNGRYFHVVMSSSGKETMDLIHRLVLKAFRGPPPSDDMQCRHLDGNAKNNRLDNLCWGTAEENARDRSVHGTAGGTRRKITDHQARFIRLLHEQNLIHGPVVRWLMARYGISKAHVWGVAKRLYRKYATESYKE